MYWEFTCDPKYLTAYRDQMENCKMAIAYKKLDKEIIKIASDFHELILFLSSILEISTNLNLKW